MAVRASVVVGAMGNLAGDDGEADLLLGEVVVGREVGVVQETQDVTGIVLAAYFVE